MLLARATNASLASPAWEMPERSPSMSAANTETPARDRPSARTCSVTVFPVPVAPATRPCRLASASVRNSGLELRPARILPSWPGFAIARSSVDILSLLSLGRLLGQPLRDRDASRHRADHAASHILSADHDVFIQSLTRVHALRRTNNARATPLMHE